MTRERFQTILDAYGADPARWPDSERAAALAFSTTSPEAQRQIHQSRALDTLLGTDDAAVPAPATLERLVAAIPDAAPSGGWRIVLRIAPVAAAAGIAAWLTLGGGTIAPPSAPELSADIIAGLGVWEGPTDALVTGSGVSLVDGAPAFGCDDPLGCPSLGDAPARESRRSTERTTA